RARRPDPLGERRHGDLRPVDPRRVHGYRLGRCRARDRPEAAHPAVRAGAVSAPVAAMRATIFSSPACGRGRGWARAAVADSPTPSPSRKREGDWLRWLAAPVLLALTACSPGGDAPEVDISAIGAGENWDNPGGDWAGSHFSRLGEITPANVGELGLAWEYDLGTNRVQEATPVVIDGVMYTSGNLGRVYALNAATGEELWTFTPELDMQVNRSACCDQANRGIAVHDGKVFVAALDGVLYALDKISGTVMWSVDTVADRNRAYTVTG